MLWILYSNKIANKKEKERIMDWREAKVRINRNMEFFLSEWDKLAHKAFLSITNSQRLLKLMSIESVMASYHFSCLPSFPASGSFPMSQFFTSGDQSIGASASASVLPMKIAVQGKEESDKAGLKLNFQSLCIQS